VPEELKQERRERFMLTQAAISRARLARRVGTEIDVLVDEVQGNVAIGRGPGDAPEIDGVVRVKQARGATPGEMLRVAITSSDEHDLAGRPARAAKSRRAG